MFHKKQELFQVQRKIYDEALIIKMVLCFFQHKIVLFICFNFGTKLSNMNYLLIQYIVVFGIVKIK